MLFENFHSETVKSGPLASLYSRPLACSFLPAKCEPARALGRRACKGVRYSPLMQSPCFAFLGAAGVTMAPIFSPRWSELFWGARNLGRGTDCARHFAWGWLLACCVMLRSAALLSALFDLLLLLLRGSCDWTRLGAAARALRGQRG